VFDIVTLFHLCEFFSEANRAYTQSDDRSILLMFVGKLRPGGLLMLYNRSSSYAGAHRLAVDLLRDGDLEKAEDYESLDLYRKPA
jgi:hypothetical protein